MNSDFCRKLFSSPKSGIFIPLFSMRSSLDWGIGDFKTFKKWINWACENNTKIIQILPLQEMPPKSNSPYNCVSAFAIDPIYICIDEIESYPETKKLLDDETLKKSLENLRENKTVNYEAVRKLKNKILKISFDCFFKTHWVNNTASALEFRKFIEINSNWLDDYSVFRTAKDIYNWHSWTHWPIKLKTRDENFLVYFKAQNSYEILFHKYLQWLCFEQMQDVKKTAEKSGVLLFGDVPFMINQESADVWAGQDIFDISMEIGAPPDDFNTAGQRWGLPTYNWWNLEAGGFAWWRKRVKHITSFFDLFRLDHAVGFFRTWVFQKQKTKEARFDVEYEHEQKARGERFLSMITEESGNACPIAEDLGVIPDFVRETLKNFNIPGYKVLRWESDGDIFRKLSDYPKVSLAVTSTHDTSTLKKWWNTMAEDKRNNLWHTMTGYKESSKFDKKTHYTILDKMLHSNSVLVILPVQDLFGLDGRINKPGTVEDSNWTYRFATEVEKINTDKYLKEVLVYYKKILISSGRELK